jgi:type I restriction enzyme M protein
MNSDAFKDIEKLETDLWEAADNLRANSKLTSSDYFMPVLGVIFLRHAANRFEAAHRQIEADQASGKMPKRKVLPADFIARRSLYLPETARYDWIMQQAAVSGADLPRLVTDAMSAIEAEFEPLQGVLPKDYGIFETKVLEDLMRLFNSARIKQATGDVFGRIYEYFLAKFSIQKAHDNGEFFTPSSLVQMIVNVIEPNHGTVLDPACGSGGMFVQSAHFVERLHANPAEKLTFYGLEKNATTIRLAKMNLAVHGLEGNIQKAITYYEDPHELAGKADFVMANPPFNVDEVDADKVKNDPRLPFGLPGVNKGGKVSNGNYLWISYFYSYLNEHGRAGFVMSSQASSAGRDEAKVRRKLIETGDVDIMIAIRSNFFYTRTVPCELWFLNRDKPKARRDKVLMIDGRNIYRKVTRKIYDFSPEQLLNLLAIVWLYRGQPERFLELVFGYLQSMLDEIDFCYQPRTPDSTETAPLYGFVMAIEELLAAIEPFTEALDEENPHAGAMKELAESIDALDEQIEGFQAAIDAEEAPWQKQKTTAKALEEAVQRLAPLVEASRNLARQVDAVFKLAGRVIEVCETDLYARGSSLWNGREITRTRKAADAARKALVEQLKRVRYYHKQAVWLTERFPGGELRDVEGLVKLVDRAELEANDYSLTPGRYVGVAPEEEDDGFDFEEALREIHVELEGLNAEAAELAARISRNFKELGI